MLSKLCVLLYLPILVYAFPNVESDLKNIKNSLLENTGLNASIPTIDDADAIMKQKCEKEANIAAYHGVMMAKDNMISCIQGLLNFEDIMKEIDEATPTGDMDIVFKKYCKKSPDLTKCVSNFVDATKPCLTPKERENANLVLNITEKLTEFVCHKEGDRIALFIAEGGPQCLMEKQDDIQYCINSTLGKYFPKDTDSPNTTKIPEFLFKPDQCNDISKLGECIVEKLKGCAEPTPANIAESLFNYTKKVTPCGDKPSTGTQVKQTSSPSSSSASLVLTNTFLLFTSIVFIL